MSAPARRRAPRWLTALLALALIPVSWIAATPPAEAALPPGGGQRSYYAAAPTVFSDTAAPSAPTTNSFWVGRCDGADLDETTAGWCAPGTTQRAAWTFTPLAALGDLTPADVTQASLYVRGSAAMFKDDCWANTLRFYDVAPLTAGDGWDTTEDWAGTSPFAEHIAHAPSCDETPHWTASIEMDITAQIKQMVAEGRTDLTLGVVADETCTGCGWNAFSTNPVSIVVGYERGPDAPTSLMIGTKDCPADAPVPVNGNFSLTALLTDPDSQEDGMNSPRISATFDVVDKGTGAVVSSQTSPESYAPFRARVDLDPSTLAQGRTYEVRVHATDGGGLTSSVSTCLFTADWEAPPAVEIVPVVGDEAVYPDGQASGGPGQRGTFWLRAPAGADIDQIWYTFGGTYPYDPESSVPYTDHATIPFVPTTSGSRVISVAAVDAAGNMGPVTTIRPWVSRNTTPTPAALAVVGPTSVAAGAAVSLELTLSALATTPYGTATVLEGSKVLGSTQFDARTKTTSVPGGALGAGTHTLTVAFEAFPGAPRWTTTHTVDVVGTLTASTPTVSGKALVGARLTAAPGTWSSGTTLTYQWKANGAAIAKATGATFVPTQAQLGKRITVTVTGSKAGYTTVSRTSSATAAVAWDKISQFTLSADLDGDRFGELLAVRGDVLVRYAPLVGVAGSPYSGATASTRPPVVLGTGFAGQQVYAPGDWNGDRKADVITIRSSGLMFLYPGKGDGTLGAARQIGNGWQGYRVVPAGDLTKDGFSDLLAITPAGDLKLYAGNGRGGFKSPYPKVGNGWTGFDLYAAGDITADGKADILSVDSRGNLWAYRGKGNGGFYAKKQVGNGWGAYTLAAGADLNADFRADIVGRDDATGKFYYYQGRGDGGFYAKKLLATIP